MKQCFDCRRMLSLDEYTENKRIYALKTDLGRNRVCKLCNFKRAVQDLKIVRLNEHAQAYRIKGINDRAKQHVDVPYKIGVVTLQII